MKEKSLEKSSITESTLDASSECSAADTVSALAESLRAASKETSELGHTRPSSDHAKGSCRPCSFFHHEGGCHQGADCGFCHLCPAGAIEERRKMKRQALRAAARARRCEYVPPGVF